MPGHQHDTLKFTLLKHQSISGQGFFFPYFVPPFLLFSSFRLHLLIATTLGQLYVSCAASLSLVCGPVLHCAAQANCGIPCHRNFSLRGRCRLRPWTVPGTRNSVSAAQHTLHDQQRNFSKTGQSVHLTSLMASFLKWLLKGLAVESGEIACEVTVADTNLV